MLEPFHWTLDSQGIWIFLQTFLSLSFFHLFRLASLQTSFVTLDEALKGKQTEEPTVVVAAVSVKAYDFSFLSLFVCTFNSDESSCQRIGKRDHSQN
jgi:hypothetical protein